MVLHPTADCDEHPAEAIATFQDPAPETGVRIALGLESDEELTSSLIATVEDLGSRSVGITNLFGVQNPVGVDDPYLEGNDISDLTPVRDMPALQGLRLDRNT